MKPPALLFILCLLASWCRAGEPYQGKGLTVELVSEVTTVRPGQPFYAGLHIKHDHAYHTYWLNPGLAGVATKLEWSLPKGWTAGSIEWPAPDKVMMANIHTHGFEREVLLMVKLTPPAKLASGEVTLKTKASWMCCAKTCSPDWRDLSLTLPVRAGSDAAWSKWRPAFEKERKQFPVPVQGWKFTASREGTKVILRGQPEKRGVSLPEEPVFFSNDNLICSHPAQQWRKSGDGFEAELEVSNLPPKDQTALRGVLRGKTGWNAGDSRGVTIQVPLK
jgi:DsbC/DsbD-like thiol-disulfide interchange protein